jgi:hypothetical protein
MSREKPKEILLTTNYYIMKLINKKTMSLATAMGTLALTATSANAAIILISAGDNGGGDVAVLNGGFESGTDEKASTTDNWDDLSGNDTGIRNQVGVNIPEGSWRGVAINRAGSERIPTVDTGYTIQTGDTFSLSFLTGGAAGWNTNPVDTLATLYTSAGDIASFAVTPAFYVNSGTGTYSSSGPLLANASAGSVGNSLQLRFETWDPTLNAGDGGLATTTNSFVAIDDVFLEVTSVPEPSTTALLGLGGLALILRRRK